MNHFPELTNIAEIKHFIDTNRLAFLYVSRQGCSVCHSLLPQVESLMENYPKINAAHIRAEQVEEVAGHFSIFTVPVLLLFVNGKEYIREARMVHMDLLAAKLDRLYTNLDRLD